ncbi:hypothetical protein [Pontimicrobium sp. MEBiC06410]
MIKLVLFLALNMNNQSMNYIEFEKLLGQHTLVVEKAIGSDFDNTLYGEDSYFIKDEHVIKDFYGMSYNFISVVKTENDTLHSITIHFRDVINRQFFDTFNEKYGEPDNIQIIENRKVISRSTGKEKDIFHQKLTKSTFDLREGTFEEKPLFIIWKKENYHIRAFLRHKQNISEIRFGYPEKLPMVKNN